MSYPINFFHIGLPKCSSTYLQSLWTLDIQYQTLMLDSAINGVRAQAKLGDNYQQNFPSLNLNLAKGPHSFTVGSSEGFTWAFVNEPDNFANIPYIHLVSAKLLGEAKLSDQILIIVRDPIRWIRSIHEQSIKEGNYQNMETFLQAQRAFIEGVLNLEFIIECWSKYFNKIVVLPLELLSKDEERFWSSYEEKLSVKPPGPHIRQKVNQDGKFYNNASIGSRLPGLAMLNMQLFKTANTYNNMEKYRRFFAQEFETIGKNLGHINMWANRRIAEYASDEDFLSLIKCFSVPDLETFQEIKLTPDMANFIEDHYIKAIEKFDYIDSEVIKSYRENLASKSIK